MWDGSETIGVQLGSENTTYQVNADGTLTLTGQQLYWQNTQTATITAWYPTTGGTIDLSDQSTGLKYVLKGTGTGNYQSAVTLNFSHALAKVRVEANSVEGYPVTVNSVKIKSYTKCAHTNGDNLTGSDEDWITMKKATYNGETYWEANVVPGQPITKFQLNDKEGTLNNNGINPVAGALNNITLTAVLPSYYKDIFNNALFKDDGTPLVSPNNTGEYNYYGPGNTVQRIITEVLKTSIDEGASKTIETPWKDSMYLNYTGQYLRITYNGYILYLYYGNGPWNSYYNIVLPDTIY